MVLDLRCPGCGSSLIEDGENCKYCGRKTIFSSIENVSTNRLGIDKHIKLCNQLLQENPCRVQTNFTLALCYLSIKNFDRALVEFNKVIENKFNNADAYFYYAICLLKGKKPFLLLRPQIEEIEQNINIALALENKAIYYLMLSYIRYDYYSRKCYVVTPNYKDYYNLAKQLGLTEKDKKLLFTILDKEIPNCFC